MKKLIHISPRSVAGIFLPDALAGMQPSYLSDLLKSKRLVSAEVALKLEKHLNINAAYLPRVQAVYGLAIASKKFEVA